MHPFSFILNIAEQVNSSALEFTSPESYYQKLVSSSKFDYTYWSPKCGGEFVFDSFVVIDVESILLISQLLLKDLGDGWAPTVLESDEELNFLSKHQNGNDNVHSYWIGGFTDAAKDYSDYYTDGEGNIMYYQNVI